MYKIIYVEQWNIYIHVPVSVLSEGSKVHVHVGETWHGPRDKVWEMFMVGFFFSFLRLIFSFVPNSTVCLVLAEADVLYSGCM